MNKDHQPIEDDDLQVSQELADALADLNRERVFVPREVDDAILAEARKQLTATAPKQTKVTAFPNWAWGAVSAVAACGVLLFSLNLEPKRQTETPQEPIQETEAVLFAREDVNQDQSVDILDAFALARRIESGAQTADLDFNQDGQTDARDVDWLAQSSVKLEKGI